MKGKTNANNEIYSHENALMVWYKSMRKQQQQRNETNFAKIK